MVEEEVENILREIRERVRAQESPVSAITKSATGNGSDSSITSREADETSAAEALARIDAYLTTTARAWDRLPPVLSNRSGSFARFELWLKRKIKRATHWFTWEQINFNAAVHHALRDLLAAQRAAQSDYSRALEKLRSEALETQQSNSEAVKEALEKMTRQLETQRAGHEQALAMLRAEMKVQIEAQRAAQTSYEQALRAENDEIKVQTEIQAAKRKEIDERLSALAQEVNVRFERIQDEQRVCFKQLSLEATEAAVLEDRARRKAEALLEELRGRLEPAEKKRRKASDKS